MKQYVDLFLLAIFIIFLYEIPEFLNDIVNNTLGKLALLGGIVGLLYQFGMTSGILGALIFVLLIHKTKEGFEVSFGITREGMKEGAKGSMDLEKEIKAMKKKQNKMQDAMEKHNEEHGSDKKKDKKDKDKKEEEDEDSDDEEGFTGSREGYKNYGSSYHLKLNDLNQVNTVKGINFRNRTDMDRDLKINAEKNKIKATAARIDGTM